MKFLVTGCEVVGDQEGRDAEPRTLDLGRQEGPRVLSVAQAVDVRLQDGDETSVRMRGCLNGSEGIGGKTRAWNRKNLFLQFCSHQYWMISIDF